MTSDYIIDEIFPVPVYCTYRDSGLDSTEKKEIEDIIKEERGIGGIVSKNGYIFDTKLKKLKEFVEQHIKIYVKEIINLSEEPDFYITQSWVNVVKPGDSHFAHHHANSIISGVFYVSTIENDQIFFTDPMSKKGLMQFTRTFVGLEVIDYQLILFPSWLIHRVEPNESTKDRISISFNTFLKGTIGNKHDLTRLVLE